MNTASNKLAFFLALAKAKTVITRRFDNRLSFHGLGFSDFLILYYLSLAPGEKMRRIDLAEAIGLTPSGVTRLLLPMEKIGLIKREETTHDARVSYVALAKGGKRLLDESRESVEVLAKDLLSDDDMQIVGKFSQLLIRLGKTIVY